MSTSELAFAKGLLIGSGYKVQKIDDFAPPQEGIEIEFSVSQFPFGVNVVVTMSDGEVKHYLAGEGIGIQSEKLPNLQEKHLHSIQVFAKSKYTGIQYNSFTKKWVNHDKPIHMFSVPVTYKYDSDNLYFNVAFNEYGEICIRREYTHSDVFTSTTFVKYECSPIVTPFQYRINY